MRSLAGIAAALVAGVVAVFAPLRGHDFVDALLLPVRLVTDSTPFLTGAPLSPLLAWLALPFACLAMLTTRSGRALLPAVAIATWLWFAASQQLRFLSGIVLSGAWLGAIGLQRAVQRFPRRIGSRLLPDALPAAVTALALATVPLYAGYSTRLGDGIRYRCFAEHVPLTGDVETLTRRLNAILEGYIRAHPEQWWWFHRRFKPPKALRRGRKLSPAGVPL